MAQKIIDVGTKGDDGTGDTIRLAGIKINSNFDEVYEFDPVKSDIKVPAKGVLSTPINPPLAIMLPPKC